MDNMEEKNDFNLEKNKLQEDQTQEQEKLVTNDKQETSESKETQQINNAIKHVASNEEQMDALKQNLKKNTIFYFLVILVCFIFTKYNRKEGDSVVRQIIYFFKLIITFIICMICGHTIHWVSHNINTLDYLNSCDNLLTRNKYINSIATFMCKIMDFHSVTHHDSSINKKFKNILF